MKKLLTLFGAITLLGTSTTSLVACNKPQYSEDELQQLKQENQINTTNQEIKDNLEWIAPQETPFNENDNKWYYVVWRGDENDNWRIVNFKHSDLQLKILDNYNEYELVLNKNIMGCLFILLKTFMGSSNKHFWNNNNNNTWKLFKVYRWNLDIQEPNLIIDNEGNIKVNV
ncbi:putative lipoprotein [Spiroplasma kunkelii CR2-3x]|uniref:Putative lipoprotein n=1 Tax=Spiroplasma kunkelii CR2-3x TaxID=273035 RepID=A0A0K2JED4_SPIKU|nr:lipoprotein [Spiroplasma kunkelii]ALA96950.1 putative lipoprotein [Spiroplasma kunkelii CR2-3x]